MRPETEEAIRSFLEGAKRAADAGREARLAILSELVGASGRAREPLDPIAAAELHIAAVALLHAAEEGQLIAECVGKSASDLPAGAALSWLADFEAASQVHARTWAPQTQEIADARRQLSNAARVTR